MTGDETPKNTRATFRGINDKILTAHCRFIAAISAEDGLRPEGGGDVGAVLSLTALTWAVAPFAGFKAV